MAILAMATVVAAKDRYRLRRLCYAENAKHFIYIVTSHAALTYTYLLNISQYDLLMSSLWTIEYLACYNYFPI